MINLHDYNEIDPFTYDKIDVSIGVVILLELEGQDPELLLLELLGGWQIFHQTKRNIVKATIKGFA